MSRWIVIGSVVASVVAAAPRAAGATGVAAYKQMTLAQLMEVEVTSVSRRAERLADVASSVQIITGEDIHRGGFRTIPEGLRLLPNLQVARVDARQWAITARGFNNTIANKMLVLMDGRTIYTPLFAGVFWDVQDTLMHDIDRIEAISGPGATQWGSNAVNGVINITTKSAKDTQGSLVTAGGGTALRTVVAARHGGTLAPGVYYRIYGKHVDHAGSQFPDGRDAPDAWRRTQGGLRIDWEKSETDTVTLQGDIYDGRIDQLGQKPIDVDGGHVLARWTRRLAGQGEIKAQAYFDRTFRRIPGSITERLETSDVDLQHRLPRAGAHDILWGAAYRNVRDDVRNPTTLAFLPAKVTHDWFSAFVQDDIALVPEKLRLMVGLRLEHNPYTGSEFQPTARLSWRLRPEQMTWFSLSRAIRSPSRIDRELFQPAEPPYIIAGGPNFEAEKLYAAELGYRAQPTQKLALSLVTYFHSYPNLRSVEPAPPPPNTSVLANGIEGHSYGAELSADVRLTPIWRLRAGYNEMRVHSAPRPGGRDFTVRGSPSLDPNRWLLLHSQLDLTPAVTLHTALRYVGRIGNQMLPAYTELDARIGWRLNSTVELGISGQNLLGPRRAEFGLPEVRRHLQRSVYAELICRF